MQFNFFVLDRYSLVLILGRCPLAVFLYWGWGYYNPIVTGCNMA
ncbi:hypothetical protein HMPREF0322_04300 [Desulfitobacterium hafniense DP7]|uniref:Uncharacterized protein n=1 Tax=Desulfitobacterium hafniense DP7 TaxID=537010 RepID=G9XTJ3_DESHA|nr:hypothetical protein HMPREF0322_04300 [Desulfitobacterium hafniense DP7]